MRIMTIGLWHSVFRLVDAWSMKHKTLQSTGKSLCLNTFSNENLELMIRLFIEKTGFFKPSSVKSMFNKVKFYANLYCKDSNFLVLCPWKRRVLLVAFFQSTTSHSRTIFHIMYEYDLYTSPHAWMKGMFNVWWRSLRRNDPQSITHPRYNQPL